jgi:putative tricarboxylic transport membrane protein
LFERALNAFWIVLGGAAAAYAWTLGIIGPSGPGSGLFPFLAALIIMAAGIVLMVVPSQRAAAPDFPRGEALRRMIGVVAGLAVMALAMSYVGFAIAGAVTMLILLRIVEQLSWTKSLVLAIASVVVVMWLFGNVLGMALPRGPWGF